MADYQIKELSHRHMAIAEFLINHPSAKLADVAQATGLSPSWVSIVTNSELFRDYFQRRHKEVSNAVLIPLQDKLNGVAHLAVEKLGKAVEESTDANFILAAADKTLKNLGFGAPKGPSVQVNNVTQVAHTTTHVSSEVLSEARAKIYQLAGVQGGEPNGPQLPPAEGVQTREEGYLGAPSPRSALVHQPQEASGAEGPGNSVRAEGLGFSGGELLPAVVKESLD